MGQYERIYSDHHDYIQPDAFESMLLYFSSYNNSDYFLVVIPMYKLNEVDPEQIFIPHDSFYRRYTFEYLARNLQPKPGLMTCLCQKPYNPNDTSPESLMHFCPRPSCRMAFHHRCLMAAKSKESTSATKVSITVKIPSVRDIQMKSREGDTIKVTRSARKHTTPQKKPLTRKAKVMKEVEDEAEVAMAIMPSSATTPAIKTRSGQQGPFPLSPRSLRLLSCSPDVDETLDLQTLVYSRNVDSDTSHVSDSEESDEEIVVPQKGRRGRPPKKRTKVKAAKPNAENLTLDSVLETLPLDLLTVAIQPLVRGGAFPAGGVAGNVGMVTRARRLVHTALQMGGGQNAVPDWEETVFGDDREVVGVGVKNAVVVVKFEDGRPKKDKGLPPFVCPNCKSAI